MKKTFLFILTLLLAVTVAFGLSSCGGSAYTVTFTVDGEVYHTATVTVGSNVQLPENPMKDGYKFTGWELDGENFSADTVISDNVTLVATWEEITNEGGGEHMHSLTHHDAVAPTCTADGSIEYWYCSGCEKNFSDSNAGNEITNIAVSKTGHTLTHYEETVTCTTDGNIEHWHCSVCKKYYSDAEATQEITSISATASHDYVDNECRRCGDIVDSKGLEYELSSDRRYYIVVGIGICEDTKIGIPSTYSNKPVTAIDDYAFYNCTSLTSIEIPNSVTSIGDSAFSLCNSLTSIEIPNSVTSIGNGAFAACTALEEIHFNAIAMNDLTYSNAVFEIAGQNGNGIKVVIGKNVRRIPAYLFCSDAFFLSPKITRVEFEEGYVPKSINAAAFSGCISLTSIEIPNSVTSIAEDAFWGCRKLVEVINKSNLNIVAGDSSYGSVAEYAKEVHNGESKIVNVDDYLFYAYNGVNYLLGYIGNKTELTLPENYNGENYEIYDYAFYYCRSLTSVTIPNSVESIGDSAFYSCIRLASVTIPNSVTSIGNSAFYRCDSLASVTIGNGVTSIAEDAFWGCRKLVEVINKSNLNIVAGDSSYGSVAEYAKEVHNGKSKIVNVNDYLFYTYNGVNYLVGYTGNDTELTLPSNYNGGNYEIYGYAFCNCTNLTSVTIPDSVTSIGDYAFYGCTSLTSVTIPDSVTNIGWQAFYNCTSLTSVTFENPNGWWYSSSSTATSGTSIASSSLSNLATAAGYLTSTYYRYYWKRS